MKSFILLIGVTSAGQPNRKNPLSCAEQMDAEIAKYDSPLDGAWSCQNPLEDSGNHGLATCRVNCDHGGTPKAVIKCRTLGRKLRAKKMDRQDCAAIEWKQSEKGKCSDLPPYKLSGKKGSWSCATIPHEDKNLNVVECKATCPHVTLPTFRCKANRGEWTPLPKKFADGLKCEKPKPKCTNKDRDRLFPVTGTGSWSCTETDDSEEKERHTCKVLCDGETKPRDGTAMIYCSSKGTDGWKIKTPGLTQCIQAASVEEEEE